MNRMALVTGMSRLKMAALLASIALLGVSNAPEAITAHGSPWRTKLRNTRTTVAALKRAARKRRNIRARSRK